MVFESRGTVAGGIRLGHPQLGAVKLAAISAGVLLGVSHPVAGGHQVELAGPDDLLRTEAVTVDDLTGQEPRDRLQPHVRVGRDIEGPRFGDLGRTHVIYEAPGAHGPAFAAGEGPADPESADLCFSARRDNRGGGLGATGWRGRSAVRPDVLGGHRAAHGSSVTRTGPVGVRIRRRERFVFLLV